MRKFMVYYNQKSTVLQAMSFDMVYAGYKCWFASGDVIFIEDIETKELRKYVVSR